MSSGVARTKTISGHSMGALRTELGYRISRDSSTRYVPTTTSVGICLHNRSTNALSAPIILTGAVGSGGYGPYLS